LSWIDLTFGGGYFVAIADGSATVIYSTDGINWSTSTVPDMYSTQQNAISYGNGYFYITYWGGFGLKTRDLVNWTDQSYTSTFYEKS
jgi:hypothetical protein